MSIHQGPMVESDELTRVNLRANVPCPHCWHHFSPESALWISQDPNLLGDPRLGEESQRRFLPTRFTVDGNALDARGLVCHQLACPQCHLAVPRAMFELQPMFVSIIGSPSSGKSYLLASMMWQLRRSLPKHFGLDFSDADPEANRTLNQYEQEQFLNPDRDQPVKLIKTQERGDNYDVVRYGSQTVIYPQPFVFTLRPGNDHPMSHERRRASRVLVLYDNAGESFEPGKDTTANPVTQHVAKSTALMFLFDPTQDVRFREACRERTDDPQIHRPDVTSRQDVILNEVASRVRRHSGLSHSQKHRRPLIVLVTKFDVWSFMLGKSNLDSPWITNRDKPICALDLGRITRISGQVRKALLKCSPEFVAAAESFAEKVVYLPVSATGRGPEVDETSGEIAGIRPRDIQPIWADIPLLLTFCCWDRGLIASSKVRTPS